MLGSYNLVVLALLMAILWRRRLNSARHVLATVSSVMVQVSVSSAHSTHSDMMTKSSMKGKQEEI